MATPEEAGMILDVVAPEVVAPPQIVPTDNQFVEIASFDAKDNDKEYHASQAALHLLALGWRTDLVRSETTISLIAMKVPQ